jgi:hypothetical protein
MPVETPEDLDEVALLRKKVETARRLVQLQETYGLLFYKPHPQQDAFHRAGGQFKRRMVRSGNRWGKTTCGMAEDVAWLLGERPWYDENDPARYAGIPNRPVKGLVLAADWDKVHELFTSDEPANPGKLWKFLPPNMVKNRRKNSSGVIVEVVLSNGSIIRFDTVKSFKQDPGGSESSDWDFIHVDEPCPEDMWKAHSRGLIDRHGCAWFTLTPLSEFWINDMFFPRDVNPTSAQAKHWSLNGTTYDNPYLSKASIREFEESLTPEERECRIHGIPLELSGLVYKEFSYDKHVLKNIPAGWDDYNQPPASYSIYWALDPHPQTPHAALFCAVSPQGQVFVYDELWMTGDIDTLAQNINAKLQGKFVVLHKCDPWAWNRDPITETNLAHELMSRGVFVEPASKAKAHGILRVREYLKRPGAFYVVPTLRRFLFEINRYCYDKENKPIDKDDHMMENLYRILINNPSFVDQTRDGGPPIQEETYAFADLRSL